MNIVIDASAWVEYFDGSLLGEKVKELMEGDVHQIFTNVLTIAELSSHYQKKRVDFRKVREIIISLSSIYPLDISFAEEAGKLHAEQRRERKSISMGDIFVLLTARKISGKIVTKDEDFRGLPEALFIREGR